MKKTTRSNGEIIPNFYFRDLIQVIIGATILALPVGFTEEVWNLGENLPFLNVFGILILSIVFISIFTYYHYHHISVKKHWTEFLKRVSLTYLFSFMVVATILILTKIVDWQNFIVSVKRVILVTFPASMSASIADTIK